MVPKSISIATSVRYGKYKKYLDNALFMVETIVKTYEQLHDYYEIPDNLSFHLAPLRGAYGRAYYYKSPSKCGTQCYNIDLDVRVSEGLFKNTLLHELTHIEQFADQRLVCTGEKGSFIWESEFIDYSNVTQEEYLSLPWELEADVKASILESIIFPTK